MFSLRGTTRRLDKWRMIYGPCIKQLMQRELRVKVGSRSRMVCLHFWRAREFSTAEEKSRLRTDSEFFHRNPSHSSSPRSKGRLVVPSRSHSIYGALQPIQCVCVALNTTTIQLRWWWLTAPTHRLKIPWKVDIFFRSKLSFRDGKKN